MPESLLGFRRGLVFRLQVHGAHLAATVLLQLIRNALVLTKRLHPSPLEGGDMDERVGAAIVGLDEAITFGVVEKFYGAGWHFCIPSMAKPDIGFRVLRAAS